MIGPLGCVQAFKDNRMNLAQEVYVFHLAFSGYAALSALALVVASLTINDVATHLPAARIPPADVSAAFNTKAERKRTLLFIRSYLGAKQG